MEFACDWTEIRDLVVIQRNFWCCLAEIRSGVVKLIVMSVEMTLVEPRARMPLPVYVTSRIVSTLWLKIRSTGVSDIPHDRDQQGQTDLLKDTWTDQTPRKQFVMAPDQVTPQFPLKKYIIIYNFYLLSYKNYFFYIKLFLACFMSAVWHRAFVKCMLNRSSSLWSH